MTDDRQILFDNIVKLCQQRGITIVQLEDATGLTRSSITKWRTSYASWDKLAKVADYFGVTIDSLVAKNQKRENVLQEDLHQLNEFFEELHLDSSLMKEIVCLIKDFVLRILKIKAMK